MGRALSRCRASGPLLWEDDKKQHILPLGTRSRMMLIQLVAVIIEPLHLPNFLRRLEERIFMVNGNSLEIRFCQMFLFFK